MTIHAHIFSLKDSRDPIVAPAGAKRTDRRSSTRPRFIESWQKTINAHAEQGDNDGVLNEKLHVTVWVAQTSSLLRAHSSFKLLTEQDRNALTRMRVRSARDSAMAAKILLRLGLSLSVNRSVTPDEWRFEKTPMGKPIISSPLPSVNFNISHADAVAIVAVSSKLKLGVDVESIDQDLKEDVVAGFCNAREQAALLGLPQTQRAREFIRLWTHKEAYTKLLGCGHSIEFCSIDCLPGATHPQQDAESTSSIHFEGFYVPVGRVLYYASLAIDPASSSLKPVNVRLVNVIGPDDTNNVSIIPTVS